MLWTRDSKNKLLFVERPERTMLFQHPDLVANNSNSAMDSSLDEFTRNNMLEVSCNEVTYLISLFFFRRCDFLFILLLKYTHNKSQSKFKCVLLCWYRILSHSQLLLSGLDYWLSRYWPPIQNLSWRAQFFFDQYSSNVFGFT